MHIAIDLDGTISKYPIRLRKIMSSLLEDNHRVTVLTAAAGELPKADRPAEVHRRLISLGFTCYSGLACVESNEKGTWCWNNSVDMVIDDDAAVIADIRAKSPNTITLMVVK